MNVVASTAASRLTSRRVTHSQASTHRVLTESGCQLDKGRGFAAVDRKPQVLILATLTRRI